MTHFFKNALQLCVASPRRCKNVRLVHERHSTLVVNREMQIEITMSYHFTPMRMAKIKQLTMPNGGMDRTQLGSPHCWWERKMMWPLWEMVWQLLVKLNRCLPEDLPIVLLGEMKTHVCSKYCM